MKRHYIFELSVKMWRFLPGVSKISGSKKIPLLIIACQQRSVNLVMLMFVGGRGGGGGGVNVFCVCVELGDWASEKLSGRVKLEGHSPKWGALQNFSFQPCRRCCLLRNKKRKTWNLRNKKKRISCFLGYANRVDKIDSLWFTMLVPP